MDIHRCRFVPYRPQSINTLAFSHRSNPKAGSPQDLRLAIGRENGDVEIWNPAAGSWVQEKILRGSRDRTVEQLVWTQDLIVNEEQSSQPFEDGPLRLFSSGGSPSITEWDLVTGQQKRHAEGHIGEIWCFAAQPQWKRSGKESELNMITAAPSQVLAAGCSDGSVILFSTADESLQYLRTLTPAGSKKKAKVISITWRDRNTVVAGYENGTIQVIDVPSRKIVRTMSLGKPISGNTSIVWTLKCLPDGTILSGDSSGELKIWDSKTLSLAQRLKIHDADILDIATSTNGDTVFSAGVDRKVAMFKRLGGPTNNKKERWHRVAHRRFHQHDVKALASFESKNMSVIVSGGMDTVPIVMPLRNWDTDYHRTLSHLPQRPQMSCSSKARLMLTWWERDLLIWNLPKASGVVSFDSDPLSRSNYQLLARIELKGDENITSAQISEDGSMVVAATSKAVKLFQIRKRIAGEDMEVRTRPVDLPMSIGSFGASSVGFSPDTKWLYAIRVSNLIVVGKIVHDSSSKDKPKLYPQVVKLERKRRIKDRLQSRKLATYQQMINCISFSSDSRTLATGDLSGAIDAWILEGHEDLQDVASNHNDSGSEGSSDSDSDSDSEDESDSRVIHGQKWIRNPTDSSLPQLDSAVLALTFKPHRTSLSKPSDSTIGLHPTRHNPHPVSHELPPLDTKLIAVTMTHQIFEFDILHGKLSDWSRRNPSSCLPQSFTQLKDRVMGAFWDYDSSAARERLWLYGPTWLFMLDMTRDLNLVDAQNKVGQIGSYSVREPLSDTAITKRMVEDSAELPLMKKRKKNTGAGDQKKDGESLITTAGSSMANNTDVVTGRLGQNNDSEDEDDEDNDVEMEGTGALTQLRRGDELSQAQDNEKLEADYSTDILDSKSSSQHRPSPPAHHTILRYRSIFGIAILQPNPQLSTDSRETLQNSIGRAEAARSTASGANATTGPAESEGHDPVQNHDHHLTSSSLPSASPNLEVILVERPIYDVDLLPRFDGGQDWGT